jgi:hypothetical protein
LVAESNPARKKANTKSKQTNKLLQKKKKMQYFADGATP